MFNNRLLVFAQEAKKYIIGTVLFQWLALIANIVLISSIGYALECVLATPVDSFHTLYQMLALVGMLCVACIVLRAICMTLSQRMGAKASHTAKTRIRQAVYDKLVALGPSYTSYVATSEAMQVSVDGAEQLEVYYGAYLPQFFYALIAPITLFAFLAPMCFPAAVVLLICVPLIPLSIGTFMTIAKKVMRRYWGSYLDLGKCFLENLSGLTTLKIYQADEARHTDMNNEAENFRQATMRLLRMQLNSITIMDLLAYGATAVGVIVTVWQFFLGHVGVAGAFTIIFLCADFFLPMRALGSLFHVAMNGMTAAEKMFDILDVEVKEEGTEVIDPQHIDISVKNVCFSYNPEKPLLRDINLTVPAGSFVGIVGESGSGKSTLAGILNGRNAGFTGSITIGGHELTSITKASLMNSVTTVSCFSIVFKGTVRSNLLMAKPDATDAELWDALERTAIAEFIRANGGLDMVIAEQGQNLSGGQRQRLSVARALLHDTPIYIFDEATSNIDADSENALLKTIDELAQTKTVIMISHRLSAVQHASTIMVLDHGLCVEQASHTALMQLDGVYAKLWKKQHELESFKGNQSSVALTGEGTPSTFVLGTDDDAPDHNNHETSGAPTRSAWGVMSRLIGLVKPLMPTMVLAIFLGILGFLAAIFITVLGVMLLMQIAEDSLAIAIPTGFGLIALCGMFRGPLRYGEQLCNHDLAFKILAVMRNKVFGSLRTLAPAKLEGKDKGNLVALITSDIELLEVFYAHTVSPVVIAFFVSLIMVIFIGTLSPVLGVVALFAYLIVGIVMPLSAHRAQAHRGFSFRQGMADMNAFVLECLSGLQETLQYQGQEKRSEELASRMKGLAPVEYGMKNTAAFQSALTGAVVMILDLVMLGVALALYTAGSITLTDGVIALGALMSSFGPVIAVATLGSTLQQTIASGNRVLDILDETPQTSEIRGEASLTEFTGAKASHVSFSYGSEPILQDIDFSVKPGQIIRIAGKSGSGKSTLCKLLMRFWDVDEGIVSISERDVRSINTSDLRVLEGYMTQETHLFTGTLRDNIALAKQGASNEEILDACRKASLTDFLENLPQGLDTQVGELGSSLSGGERQRIGLARVFLHDAPFILLDEPTSNLDSLNEAAVLRALVEGREGKTIALISHRESTGCIADMTVTVERGRVS